VIFPEEEGSRFGRGLLGSSIWTGTLEADQLSAIRDGEETTYLEAMAQAGFTVDDSRLLKPDAIAAMLEVHIEQGAVLEKQGYRIGLVEAIAGIRQLKVTIKGTADHAGTTPMTERSDPLQAAARIIIDVKLSRGEMTFDEAVHMLMDEAGMDEGHARTEVSRYTMTPGYPLSYLLGRHLIMEARKELEDEFGSKFDLKLFHDTIVNAGSIPVSFIPQIYRVTSKK